MQEPRCPRCDEPILEGELVTTKRYYDSYPPGEVIEIWEHRPARGCGKWFWRRSICEGDNTVVSLP